MNWHDSFYAAFVELVTLYKGNTALGGRLIGDHQQPMKFAVATDADFLVIASSPVATRYFTAFRAPAYVVLQLDSMLAEEV